MGSRDAIRVLRVITRLNVGGPSLQAAMLSQDLAPRGFDTVLVHGALGEGEGDMRYLVADSVRLHPMPSLQRELAPAADAITLARLVGLLRRVRPHIVHTHMAKAGTLGRAAAAIYHRSVARRDRARVVHTYHGHVLEGYFSPAKTRVFIGIERRLAAVTDRLVAISPQIRDELVELHRIGRREQYRVIPLGFDLSALVAVDVEARRAARRTLDIPADAHVVTTVGRLTAIKQHRLFLEVAALVARDDPAALFLVVGDGELRGELEAAARDAAVADRTRFLGWRRDLAVIYAATDVTLLTSRNEGTPVALIESLAAGVPGVATAVGGVPDVIAHGETGLLAPFGDARALADAVAALAGNRARREAMGVAGRRAVAARFDRGRLLDDIERLYRDLLT